jgi:uncharacterized tellurite resistance protein B-like protein
LDAFMIGIAITLAVLVAIGAGVAVWRRAGSEPEPPEPPPSQWKGGKITPMMAGARNKAPERVSRDAIMAQAVLLAAEMATSDGKVEDDEKDAIRQFILDNVTDADEAFAETAMRKGFDAQRNTAAVDAAIATIRAVGSAEQRVLILELLVHVAQADGVIHHAERAFMERVGERMGLDTDEVERMISLDDARGPDS